MRKCRRVGWLVGALAVLVAARAVAEEALPETARGFLGAVSGVVKAKGEKNTFQFQVSRVIRAGDDSKAQDPKALEGRTIRVGPRYEQALNGEWRPMEQQVAYIAKLEVGQELTLPVRNVERDEFAIVEVGRGQQENAGALRRELTLEERARREAEIKKRETEMAGREGNEAEARRMREGGGGAVEGREKEMLIKVLRDELRQVHAENADLRRQLDELRAGQKEGKKD